MDIVLAVKHMRDQKCKFRVLGLSATPGADGSKVQAGRGRAPGFVLVAASCYAVGKAL
jgi:hypothetical protein